jgi:hypothetical protein
MTYQYITTDATGERIVEDFSPEQFDADRRALREFEALEAEVASHKKLGVEHEVVIRRVRSAIPLLPPGRAAHWQRELKRIGIDP